MVSTPFFFSSVVDPVRTLTSIGNTSPLPICSLESPLKLILIYITDLEHEGEFPLVCMGVIAVLKFYGKFWWSAADNNSIEVRHELYITKKRYSGGDRGYDVVRELDLHADHSCSYSAPTISCI